MTSPYLYDKIRQGISLWKSKRHPIGSVLRLIVPDVVCFPNSCLSNSFFLIVCQKTSSDKSSKEVSFVAFLFCKFLSCFTVPLSKRSPLPKAPPYHNDLSADSLLKPDACSDNVRCQKYFSCHSQTDFYTVCAL